MIKFRNKKTMTRRINLKVATLCLMKCVVEAQQMFDQEKNEAFKMYNPDESAAFTRGFYSEGNCAENQKNHLKNLQQWLD